MTPQKMALCSAMRKQAKLTPKTMAKYLLRSPISIFKAIQVMSPSLTEQLFTAWCDRQRKQVESQSVFHNRSPLQRRENAIVDCPSSVSWRDRALPCDEKHSANLSQNVRNRSAKRY